MTGFFVGWPNPPDPATQLRLLQGSYRVVLALDPARGQVIGFINALSDGLLSAFIPLLAELRHLYSIDLLCDPNLQPFSARLGLVALPGTALRNYDRQSGS
ncbi:MAG: GNAT family N-acetyltransferase [Anaerolineae bacterium]|nr:GNAT family N-acetyltransferase [Anaerolineae bacterium]